MKSLLLLLSACALGISSQTFAFSIAGTVFCDANTNGVFDAGESGLGNIPVRLVSAAGAIADVTTEPDGTYLARGLSEDDWTVTITPNPDSNIVAPPSGNHVVTLVADGMGGAFVDGVDFAVDDPSCRPAFCGDGFLDPNEQCDDGNNNDGDGCSAVCTIEQCGNGIVDPGEQCDDGNIFNGDGCSAMCEVETGGEGCTPGYWRQEHHFDSYPDEYPPTTLFVDAFGVDAFPGQTISEVTRARGGGLNALGRHAVAALLNAASADVDYDRTVSSIISSFAAAYSSMEYEFLKNVFESFNEQGCPLN